MRTITIDGKERRIKGTFGAMRRIIKKYKDLPDMKNWPEERILMFAYELIWLFLDYTFKPYMTFRRFRNKADIDDIRKGQGAVLDIFLGIDKEDKDPGNGEKRSH
jgi:hypothetical protein